MVFSSILFLFRFLPIALLITFLTPRKYRNLALLILSFVFYSWGEVKYFPIMIASILVDYIAGQGIKRNRGNKKVCKRFLLFSMIFNLGMLLFFKYTDFFINNVNALTGWGIANLNIVLPLGISFYTFQTMSYTIDVYWDRVEAEDNIIDFGAYVVLFPQLIAGPIVKYTDIDYELKHRKMNLENIHSGIDTFVVGLGSKVLVANSVGALWTEVEALGFTSISTPLAWLGLLAFSLQIYFDFSGYSLMAIGLGKMLGFEFPQNFDYPYISKSFTEFWRRWHMTLGSWFREYLYIPLGGNRCSTARNILNLFIVWGLTGFWHGASWNFVLWGLYFFVLLVLEKYVIKKFLDKHPILARVYVIPLTMFSWALFSVTDFHSLKLYFVKLLSYTAGNDWMYYLRNYGIVLVIGMLLSTPILEKIESKLRYKKAVRTVFLMVVFIVSIAYLVDATYNPFLYFRF